MSTENNVLGKQNVISHPTTLINEFTKQYDKTTQLNIETPFIEGQFLYIKDKYSRDMLINAWLSVTELGLWEYMKNDTHNYMISYRTEVNDIYKKMEELGYYCHSGYSFTWTMQQIHYIAKNGEQKYANGTCKVNNY